MACLLDFYSSIADEITKIHINPTSSYKTLKEQEKYFDTKFRSMLNVLTEKLDQNKTCVIQNPQPHIYSITFLYDTIYPGLDILSKVELNRKSCQISCSSTVLRNYVPIRIKEKEMKLSINRYLIRINGILKNGSINLNPFNGEIVFCMNSFLSIYQFEALIFEPMKLVQFLVEELSKTRHYIRIHIYKILYLMNEIDQKYSLNPALEAYQIKQINAFSKATIKLIDKTLPFLHLEFSFMYNENTFTGTKNVSQDTLKKMTEMIKLLKYNSKLIQDGVNKCMGHLSLTKQEVKSAANYTFNDDEKKDIVNILLPPFLKHSTGEPPYVYSQIEIKNDKDINWEVIDQGGFGMIRKAMVQFVYKKDMEKFHPRMNYPFSRTLVKKDDFEHNTKSKLNHEKEILSNMKHSISPFIAKFYFSQQQGFNQSLLIEYCPQKSFASFRQKNKEFMTLNSKLIFLKFIAQSLKFLKDHKVCHLDLKPSNILFGSGHVKLIDFGEAYHPEVCQKNFRPGTSLPYAPPESFSQQLINFSDRLDIFSFGILMHEILYDTYPVEHSKYHYNRLKQAYTERTYLQLIQMAPQKAEYTGYKQIFRYLTYLIVRCLDKEEKKRPCVEWIIIVLQCCISLQQHLSYW